MAGWAPILKCEKVKKNDIKSQRNREKFKLVPFFISQFHNHVENSVNPYIENKNG